MNNNLISLGALVISVFMAGSFLGSGIKERQEMRKEIDALKVSQAQILVEVQQANKDYQEKQKKFNEETQAHNQKLATLSTHKKVLVKDNVETNKRIDNTKQGIEFDLTRLNKYIAANPMKMDSLGQPIQ
jgi:sugar diacid utilization regulator